MLSGNNGILTKAGDAKTLTGTAQIQEQIQLAYHAALTSGLGTLTDSALNTELTKEFGANGYALDTTSNASSWKVTVNGVEVNLPAGTTTESNNTNKTIQIVATEMPEDEINEKGITRQEDNSVIIKVTQQVQAPTKEQLQALEESNSGKIQLQNMYAATYRMWGVNMTWEGIVQRLKDCCGVTVTNISQAFTADFEDEEGSGYDIYGDNPEDDVHVNDVYELIIQTGAYVESLKYSCNNEEKTGTEVYFEITEAGDYNIVAKDENNNMIGITSYTLKRIAQLVLSDGTVKSLEAYEGKTWYEFATDPNNTESYLTEKLGEPCDLKTIIIEHYESNPEKFFSWTSEGCVKRN